MESLIWDLIAVLIFIVPLGAIAISMQLDQN
jgi:hypothetical protein